MKNCWHAWRGGEGAGDDSLRPGAFEPGLTYQFNERHLKTGGQKMQKVELFDRLTKSRAGRALLSEIEADETAESAWKEAAAELRELRAELPKRRAELEAQLKEAQSEVVEAKEKLRLTEERAGKAFRDYHTELYLAERRTIALQDLLYKNAPGALLAELAELREKLLDNMDNPPGIITTGTDLGRRKVYHDRTAVDAHLEERKKINAAIADIERRILGGIE